MRARLFFLVLTYAIPFLANAGEIKTYPVVVVVNGKATPSENSNPAAQVIETDYQKLMGYHHNEQLDKYREARLTLIKQRISALQLTTERFSFTFIEDKDGKTYSDIRFSFPRGAGTDVIPLAELPNHLKPRPSLQRPTAPITLEQLEELNARHANPAEILDKTLFWIVQAPPDSLRCQKQGNDRAVFTSARVQTLFQTIHAAMDSGAVSGAFEDVIHDMAPFLNREERLRLIEENDCLTSLYSVFWKVLKRDARADLFSDFEHWSKYLTANQQHFVHDGSTETVNRLPSGPAQLDLVVRYLEEMLASFGNREIMQSLPIELRRQLARDTNLDDPASRTEFIDILSAYSSSHRFKAMTEETTHTTVSRWDLIKKSMQHKLAPETYLPVIVVEKSSAAVIAKTGSVSYFLYCGGDSLQANNGVNLRQDGIIETISYPAHFLESISERNLSVGFSCDDIAGQLGAKVNVQMVPFSKPKDARFVIGPDRKIKAVTTLNLIDAISKQYLFKLKLGPALAYQYRLVEERPISNVKEEFLSELKDSDFYFPINHFSNQAEVPIGQDNGTRLRFQRVYDNGVTGELVMFVPHTDLLVNYADHKFLTRTELGRLFRDRRALAEKRRLVVMSLKCGEVQCVPAWMRFYTESLELKATPEETEKMVDELSYEIPLAIGARRSFDTRQESSIIDHSKYPFTALDKAAHEAPLGELIEYLTLQKYMPVTSFDQTNLEIKSKNKSLAVILYLPNGKQLIFDR